MLDLEVVPERSIGCEQWDFILGMHFSQTVVIIQSQVGVIKGVQVYCNDSNPLEYDIILSLPQDGIRFIFDAVSQRLKVIEVFNMKLVKLKYCNVTFNSSEVVPTIQEIEQCFGATHPGIYDGDRQLFVLNFRGLSFCFEVDPKFQPGIAQSGLGSLQFAPGVTLVASKMIVYSGNNFELNDGSANKNEYSSIRTLQLPICCYRGLAYVENIDIIRDRNSTKIFRLLLYLQGGGTKNLQKITVTRDILFGMSCQDVASLLGSPSQIFYKSEDKMKIHSPNVHLHISSPRRSDFFFNYFSLGLDILFDAKCQRMKKLVVHTNYPGHYNFNMYHRCNFRINLQPDKVDNERPNSKPIEITAYTKWDQICDYLKHSERPVVLNRSASANSGNLFGSTFCYGYQDMIFEIMQNQHIASVTFYRSVVDISDNMS